MNNKLLLLIFREKKTLLLGTLAGFIIFLSYLFFLYKPSYKTEIKLFVRNIPTNDIITTYKKSNSIQSQSGLSNPLYNLMSLLKSDLLTSEIYDYLKEKYPDDLKKLKIKSKDKFYKPFPKRLKTKVEPSTDIIKVSLKWINKNNTVELMNQVVREFKEINLELFKVIRILFF